MVFCMSGICTVLVPEGMPVGWRAGRNDDVATLAPFEDLQKVNRARESSPLVEASPAPA